MNVEILASGLVAARHAGSSGAMVMLALFAAVALVALGVRRWRR